LNTLFTYQALDATVRLKVCDPALLPVARDLHSVSCRSVRECTESQLADLVWEKPVVKGHYGITLQGQPWEGDLSLADLFIQSENLITQLFLQQIKHAMQIHAAAVVAPNGQGWMISGDSGAGKTSLTLLCLLNGWRCLTDEFVFVPSPDSRVVQGLQRNFNLKERSFGHFPQTQGLPHSREFHSPQRKMDIRFIDPSQLVRDAFTTSAQITTVLFPQYDPTAARMQVTAKSALETLNLLLPQVNLWQPWSAAWLSDLTKNTRAFDLRYSDPRQCLPETIAQTIQSH
jgi:hypothetical protein